MAAAGQSQLIAFPADPTERRIAAATALAVRVFGNKEKAARWLRRPRRDFGGVSPLEMLETAAAGRQVTALLQQLEQVEDDEP